MKKVFWPALTTILTFFTSCMSVEQDVKNLISDQKFSQADSIVKLISDQELKDELIALMNSEYILAKRDSTKKWRYKEELKFQVSSSEDFHEQVKQLVFRAQDLAVSHKLGHYDVSLNLETWHFIFEGLLNYNGDFSQGFEFTQNFGYSFVELENLPEKLISNDSTLVQQALFYVNQVVNADKRIVRQRETVPVPGSLADLNYDFQSLDVIEKLGQIRKNNQILKSYFENNIDAFKIIANYRGIRLYEGPVLMSIEEHSDGSIGYHLLKNVGTKYIIYGPHGDFFEIKGNKILVGDDDGYL